LITETNNLGTVLKSYIWRDNTPVAIIDASSGQDKLYTLEVDSLDTPRTARNESGAIIWQWNSDAFGTTLPNEDPDGDGISTKINLRFPGQYYDAESGLHYNMARYYDPKSGRYLQPDPIGLAGGMNSFGYVEGNPVNFIDRKGLSAPYFMRH
jgi:RHS repeat-associated protein